MDMSKTGAELIADERQRQITSEGYTADHDDDHSEHELRNAAIAYVLSASEDGRAHGYWPFAEGMKPSDSSLGDLVKAGALIAAEIDRVIREM